MNATVRWADICACNYVAAFEGMTMVVMMYGMVFACRELDYIVKRNVSEDLFGCLSEIGTQSFLGKKTSHLKKKVINQ